MAASKLHKHRGTCCTAEWTYCPLAILRSERNRISLNSRVCVITRVKDWFTNNEIFSVVSVFLGHPVYSRPIKKDSLFGPRYRG